MSPIELVLRNLIQLQRLSNGVSADAAALLEEAFNEIIAQLMKHDPTIVSDRYRQARVDKIVDSTIEITRDTFRQMVRQIRDDLARIGVQQARWAAGFPRAIGGVAVDLRTGPGVGINLFKSIVDRDPFQGLTLGDWAEGQRVQTVQRVRQRIQLGMLNNETTDDIVRRVRGASAGILRDDDGNAIRTKRGGFVHRFEGGVLESTTKDATALVRTATNWIANDAHVRTYRENADVVDRVRFTATLDARTTLRCASLDGTEYAVDDPTIPRPPLHWQCRSVLTPVIDWEQFGIEPPEGERASEGGPVADSMTYEQWLRNQPAAKQDEILGPRRAELFRSGKTLRDMVRADGSVIRLDELEPAV